MQGKAQPKATVFDMPLEKFSVAGFNRMLGWLGVSGCSYKKVLRTNDKAHGSDTRFSGGGKLGKYLAAHRSAIRCT